jgi:hypothetical protein
LDWSNERYVRIYVRDTKTWKLLGWEGQAVLCLLARRFDRSGLLDDVRDADDVSLMIGCGFPVEIADVGLQRIIDRGVMEVVEDGLLWPKFLEAQEAAKTDKQRQREFRERRRADAKRTKLSRNVTKPSRETTERHGASQPVTPTRTVPCSTVLTDLDRGLTTPINPDSSLTLEDPSSPLSSSDLTSETGTKKKKTKGEAIGAATWEAYSTAYAKRYGVPPVRNQQSNALCKSLVKALGAEDAPAVAAYYVTSNYAYYVQRGHNLKILVSDAVKLRTEWATGQRVTQSQAREGDRLQGQGDAWRRVIKDRGRS